MNNASPKSHTNKTQRAAHSTHRDQRKLTPNSANASTTALDGFPCAAIKKNQLAVQTGINKNN